MERSYLAPVTVLFGGKVLDQVNEIKGMIFAVVQFLLTLPTGW